MMCHKRIIAIIDLRMPKRGAKAMEKRAAVSLRAHSGSGATRAPGEGRCRAMATADADKALLETFDGTEPGAYRKC